ncbi:MAG: DNA recombination protein RmuC [Bacteroidales bacterium]|nr:DNA recombination protein RmuC [Bacteroidales bacterium]
MEKTNLIILCVALALIAVLVIVWIVTAGRSRKSFLLRLSEKDEQIRLKDEDIRSRDEAVIRAQAEAHTAQELRKNDAEAHANTLKMLKEANETALRQQIEAIRSQMTAETEKLLKQREEAISKKADETFKVITGSLGKDLKSMQDAFDAQKKTQTEGAAQLKEAMEQAVKNLQAQTSSIGAKADNLASALKGQNKTAGNWGEVILYNMLVNEGMVEGRDFDREETLRDQLGLTIHNEDSNKRMRPDYILHYPDRTEVIIDAKVSLDAYSDWFAAEDPAQKEDAAQRNLQAIRAQIKDLSGKRYPNYIREGYKSLDYVVMFIPNYGSLQLAKSLAPNLFNEAYGQGVLLATEETLMPFLRMIRIAWTNYDQVRNQEKIIKAAQNMIDRVYDFSKAHATMGDKLHDALKQYDIVSAKIDESGQSILTSARQLIKLGVPKNPKKPLPEGPEEA